MGWVRVCKCCNEYVSDIEETIVLRNKLLTTTLHLGIRCFIHCHTVKWLVNKCVHQYSTPP